MIIDFERLLCLQFMMIKLVTKLIFFDKELVYLIASIHTEKTTRFTRENNYYTFFFTFDLQKTSRSAELA